MGETVRSPGLDEPVVHPDRELGRDEQLPAELADEAHPHGQPSRLVQVDLLRVEVRERLVRQVGGRQFRQEPARVRALQADQTYEASKPKGTWQHRQTGCNR